MTESLLTADEVAALLNVSRRTVWRTPGLRSLRIYVTPTTPRWRKMDLDRYLEKRQQRRAS